MLDDVGQEGGPLDEEADAPGLSEEDADLIGHLAIRRPQATQEVRATQPGVDCFRPPYACNETRSGAKTARSGEEGTLGQPVADGKGNFSGGAHVCGMYGLKRSWLRETSHMCSETTKAPVCPRVAF